MNQDIGIKFNKIHLAYAHSLKCFTEIVKVLS